MSETIAAPVPSHTSRPRRWLRCLLGLAVLLAVGVCAFELFAEDKPAADDVVGQLRLIPSSTIADAMDEVLGKRGYMNYDMRPITKGRMVGRAKTVLYGPITANAEQAKLGPLYGVQTIDSSGPGDVLVIAIGDPNVTGLGGLMATTAKVRGMEGVVVDGAVRDLDQIEDAGLLVFARSVSPSTSVGRWTSLAKNIPVPCAGVTVNPGDYIVGDRDGVVCIPAEHLQPVLKRSMEYEATEKKMFPKIRELKSLEKVIQMFKRI